MIPWGPDSIPPVAVACRACGGAALGDARLGDDGLERRLCACCGADNLQATLMPHRSHNDFRRLWDSRELQTLELRRIAVDPWYWLVNYVVTEDSHWVGKGLETAYQRFPPLEYLRSCTYLLWSEPFTAWIKARQMLMTWLVSAYMLGEACLQGGRLYMIQSKLEDDSCDVLKRLVGIYDRLRQFAPWSVPKERERSVNRFSLGNGSSFIACAQGAHNVQSHTPAWLFADEVQLQDEMEGAYHQALPACERITLVGSADYSWFCQNFIVDKLGSN